MISFWFIFFSRSLSLTLILTPWHTEWGFTVKSTGTKCVNSFRDKFYQFHVVTSKMFSTLVLIFSTCPTCLLYLNWDLSKKKGFLKLNIFLKQFFSKNNKTLKITNYIYIHHIHCIDAWIPSSDRCFITNLSGQITWFLLTYEKQTTFK